MAHPTARRALAALPAVAVLVLGAPAAAAPTATAPLTCGSEVYTVSGFGRGQAFHVEGSNRRFVVTRADLAGTTVFDAPGQAGRADVVTCTTTPPGSQNTFVFQGFFTPRR